MWGWVTAYLLLGLISALLVFRIFPAEREYRPSLGIRISSAVGFMLLWPILVLLVVTYGIGFAYRCYIGEESTSQKKMEHFLVRMNRGRLRGTINHDL